MSGTVSTTTEVILVDSRVRNGTVSLPLSSEIPNRILTIKDAYGNANLSSITIQTQGSDTFENGATSITLALPYEHLTVYAGLANKWIVQGGSRSFGFTASTISSVYANIGSLSASTINGLPASNYVSTGSLLSTTFGVLCTISTAVASGVGAGVTSTISTSWFMTSSVFASTISSLTANISSLTVNSLQIGNGTSWLDAGPLRATALSTLQLNAGASYTTSNYFGTTSSGTALLFYGLQGGFQQTALAELSTGVGTQELLVFKGSSVSDRIRMQTTGSIVFEPGVAARIFSTTLTPPSNLTPAMIINASSNVGIQTATPQAALDVAGSIRGNSVSTIQSLTSSLTANSVSSLNLFTSSMQATNISTQHLAIQSSLRVAGPFGSTLGMFMNISSQLGLNVSTPLTQLHLKDLPYSLTTIPMALFDKDSTVLNLAQQIYTGNYINYTVPSGVNTMNFYMWGAGGSPTNAGAGAFITGTIPTTPGETLRIIVGRGGIFANANNPTDAQGGAGSNVAQFESGQGGGRSAIQRFLSGVWTEIATAGGGGGGCTGFGGVPAGNARWIGQSEGGSGTTGATQTAGGSGPSPGTFQKGGTSASIGGSGGGGYYGGGGGTSGGGGSSFVLSTLNSAPYVTNYNGINGNRTTAIGTTYPGYLATPGIASSPGSNGLVALQYSGFRESDYMNMARGGTVVFTINAAGGAALGKSAVTSNYLMDVAGSTLATQMTATGISTQSLFASTIQAPVAQFSTLSTLALSASTIQAPVAQFSTLSTVALSVSSINGNPYTLASADSNFIAIMPGTTTTTTYYTYDGLTWNTGSANSNLAGAINGLVFNGNYWVATSGNTYLVRSANGINWTTTGTSLIPSGSTSGLCWDGTRWLIGTTNGNIYISYDLTTYILTNASLSSGGNNISDIVFNGSVYVAIANRIPIYSFNGLNWFASSSIFDYYGLSLLWTGKVFLAFGKIGGDGGINVSYNGITWTNNGFGGSIYSELYDGATNGSVTIVVGFAVSNRIATSTDGGISWTSRTSPFDGGTAYSITWNGSHFYALGNNSLGTNLMARTVDGITWTTVSYLPGNPATIPRRMRARINQANQWNPPTLNPLSTLRIGAFSTATTLAFNGLQGGYNQTVLAELSTGTGKQEFLTFKGSSPFDTIRTQTTGSILFEAGMPQRVYPFIASNSTPTMILTGSTIGMFVSSPQAQLDVGGTIRASNLLNLGTICTNSLVIYGPSTLTNQGSTILEGPVYLASGLTGPNNLVTSSILLSTVSGIEQSIISSSSGVVGVSSTLSTFLFLTSSIRASSIFTDGTQTIQFSGTASDVSFGTNTDTLTLAAKSDPYTGAIASMAFGVSTNAYPLARIYALDSALSGSPLSELVFQNVPVSGTITEAMRIGTNGYLGIGKTKPATSLDVSGTGRFDTMSTLVSQTSSLLTNSLQLGTTSTINSLTFFGLEGGYNQTAFAELSTGAGLQELLMFKGSSVSDRIRMQTTGSIVFEPGVAARVFSSDGTTTGSNLTPAMIVNASSNVGIQTASPQTTLDVAGTGRFQTLSTLQTNTSSLTLTTMTAAGSTILSGPVFLTGQLTGVNNLITSSMLTSTVAGLGQIYLSTATAGGVTSTLSTSMLFTSSIRASSIFTDGTQTIQFSGSASGALYGPNVDTLTLATKSAPYTGAIASMAFGVSTNAYPLARIYAVDAATSGSPLSQLVFQNLPVSATSFASNYTYTGADQTFVVPTGVTSMQVTLWGAGGGGGQVAGGAGAFVQGTLIVSPGQTYRLVVGQGGVYNTTSAIYGGGGTLPSVGGNAGTGGGRSGVQLLLTSQITSSSGSGSAITFTFNGNHGLQSGQPINVSGLSPSGFNGNFAVASMPSGTQITVVSTQAGSSTGTGTVYAEVVNAGAGGGGGQPGTGGPAAFSGTGFPGPTVSGNPGGTGGTQAAGGTGGGTGSILQGGTAGGNYAGGGGGGFYGGGGGIMNPGINSGGGGGSSYTSYAAFTLTAGSNSPNTANQAPATAATGYIAGVAVGGNGFANGGSGLVLLNSLGGTITEAMRIGSNGYLGIGTTTPATNLDVAGTGRFQTVSTLALNISTINGAVLTGPSGWSAFPALQTVNFSGSTLSNVGSTLYVKTQNFDPRSIKGLQTWLDASDPSTFMFTTGSNLNRWLDKSGQGNHTSNAGTVVASTMAVVFNAVGMNSPLNASGMVSNTFKEYGFVVFTTSANNAYILVGPSYYQGRQITIQNGGAITNVNNGGETIASLPSVSWANTQPQLLDWSSGGYLALNASNLVNSGSNYTSYMGPWAQRTTSFGTNLVGTIREVIIYQGVTLSSNEVYAVEGYLASKWGFQANLPPAHLYKTIDIRTSSITTYDGTVSVDAANNMTIQPADYLSRISLSFPNTSPNLILNGHTDMRMTILDTSIMNTGIGIYPTLGSFGTTYRIPYASGGVSITFPVFISSNDIGGYWDFYNNSGSNQAITIANGNGIANFTLTPFATTRAIWNGTANYLTSATPWPTYLTQDIGNTRLGINVAPAYTLDVTGSSRFTSNVGIGIVPNTGLIALDVANQARFGSVSTLRVFTSSILGNTLQTFLVSTLQTNTSSLNVNTISAITANISSISTNSLVFGDGTGFVDIGDILATSISTIFMYAGALYSTSNFLGTQSSLTALQFFGLQGGYNNTALAEMSTGIGSQEFLIFKGSSAQDRIRAQTTGTIVFEAGMPQRLFSTGQVGSNSTPTMILTSTSVGIFLSTPQTTLDVGGTARAHILSTLNLNISSINNASYPPPSGVGAVVSTSKLLTSSLQASSISSFQAYFSTLTIDTLTVGTGAGWFDLGPVRTTALSTFQANIDSNYTNTLFVGNQSSITDILFFGLQGNYNNTALAEISTGTGLQEFLVFKGSSASDRIRMQTTGSIIFEPGVSARLFSTNGATTGSNLTPAMIINSSSNVGIQTANPAANTALDVAGTGRFQTLSTLSLYAGAIYGGVFFA